MNRIALLVLIALVANTTIAGAAVVSQSTTMPSPAIDKFFTFYASNLRASLFSGFLTLGSFLIAVNTFVVVNLKKEVYDHEKYKSRVIAAKRGDSSASFYGPLRRLSGLIHFTVMLAISASIAQLTVGVLIERWYSAAACLLLAAIAIGVLVFLLYQIRCNLVDWFNFLEETAEEQYRKTVAQTIQQTSSAATPESAGDAEREAK